MLLFASFTSIRSKKILIIDAHYVIGTIQYYVSLFDNLKTNSISYLFNLIPLSSTTKRGVISLLKIGILLHLSKQKSRISLNVLYPIFFKKPFTYF